jgi:hypothetical protein
VPLRAAVFGGWVTWGRTASRVLPPSVARRLASASEKAAPPMSCVAEPSFSVTLACMPTMTRFVPAAARTRLRAACASDALTRLRAACAADALSRPRADGETTWRRLVGAVLVAAGRIAAIFFCDVLFPDDGGKLRSVSEGAVAGMTTEETTGAVEVPPAGALVALVDVVEGVDVDVDVVDVVEAEGTSGSGAGDAGMTTGAVEVPPLVDAFVAVVDVVEDTAGTPGSAAGEGVVLPMLVTGTASGIGSGVGAAVAAGAGATIAGGFATSVPRPPPIPGVMSAVSTPRIAAARYRSRIPRDADSARGPDADGPPPPNA